VRNAQLHTSLAGLIGVKLVLSLIHVCVAFAFSCVLPTWAEFELGLAPVYWETANGRPPAAGELLTLWFNPEAAKVTPNDTYGIAFNGGFNSPIMCGGEPRQMTRKGRGPRCTAFYSIKINVPVHARTLEFTFTDGSNWHGDYVLEFDVPVKWKNQPMSWFNEQLREELSKDGACSDAIFPDSVYIQDRCLLPGGLGTMEGQACELDIVPGCMDISSPFYDPLATVDDGSCPIDTPAK
jgi:hypothetical protein